MFGQTLPLLMVRLFGLSIVNYVFRCFDFHEFWLVFMTLRCFYGFSWFLGAFRCFQSICMAFLCSFLFLSLPSSMMRFFLLSHQDRCFWSSMTIACNYFQWSVTIGPPMWWLRCIAQLQTCYQAVSNITIKISNKIRDLQVDIINSQNHFTQVSPALCEVVP